MFHVYRRYTNRHYHYHLTSSPKHITDKSFQSVTCTGTDNLTQNTRSFNSSNNDNKRCGRLPQYTPCKLTFDLLTLKVVVSESRVTWAPSVPILVFLGLSVLDIGPTYATDRQTSSSDVRRASSLNASALWVQRHSSNQISIAPYGCNL